MDSPRDRSDGKTPVEKNSDRPVRFGYVGRIDYRKGLHLIIDALEEIPFEKNVSGMYSAKHGFHGRQSISKTV